VLDIAYVLLAPLTQHGYHDRSPGPRSQARSASADPRQSAERRGARADRRVRVLRALRTADRALRPAPAGPRLPPDAAVPGALARDRLAPPRHREADPLRGAHLAAHRVERRGVGLGP